MSTEQPDDAVPELLWEVRASIYAHFATTGRAPTLAETGAHFGMSVAAAADLYHALNARHAILLDAESSTIRMANPFSGIPTGFQVMIGPTQYWANCIWDALGIPAALSRDATITVADPAGRAPLKLHVGGGEVAGDGLVHFLLPFERWYDDLVET
jgi:hypothetical protein